MGSISEQKILEKIQRLDPQQVAEVINFIEFIADKKEKQLPLVKYLLEIPGARIGVHELRKRLTKIRGNMSDIVRELRDERG